MAITYPNFSSLSPLQKHVAFFDKNEDGILTVSETAQGLQELGQGKIQSWFSASVIHLGLAPSINDSIFKLDIDMAQINKGKHDSDTDIYLANGELDLNRFDTLFTRFDANRSGSLSVDEVTAMRAAVKEKNGGLAAKAEWSVLMSLLSDTTETNSKGKDVKALTRASLASFYSGTLLFEAAERRSGITPSWF